MSEPTKEDVELKPCPYHGDPSAMRFSTASKEYACCEKCATNKGEEWYRPVESWNNAWAWKEIESLKKENLELKALLDVETTNAFEDINELREVLKKYEEKGK